MKVVYSQQSPPPSWSSSLFLAGPTPRSRRPVPSWRPDALAILERMGYDGVVFVPETEDGRPLPDYQAQIDWETEGLNQADVIVFWVPRELETMPAFTTNVEFGRWVDSHKCVLGHPKRAPKTQYLDAIFAEVTGGKPTHHTLEATLGEALERIGAGAMRSGGERSVPMHLWRTPMFQAWYRGVLAAGNRLEVARVRWVFRAPENDELFAFVLWVRVWVASEERAKDNEWVFARTDVCSVVLYRRADDVLDSELVLVREFRSPGRTPDGFIHELPSGSSDGGEDAGSVGVAIREVEEETSLVLPSERFVALGSRQIAGTVSSHHGHVFAVELTESEMQQARALATNGVRMGVAAETERTVLEVTTLREMLQQRLVDWSTLGMVSQALLQR